MGNARSSFRKRNQLTGAISSPKHPHLQLEPASELMETEVSPALGSQASAGWALGLGSGKGRRDSDPLAHPPLPAQQGYWSQGH